MPGKAFVVLFCSLFGPAPSLAAAPAPPMEYIYNAPETPSDIRYQYQWEILRTALVRSEAKYGPFTLRPSVPMSEKRQTDELMNASALLNVMYLGTKPEFEKGLYAVHIPVDKDLGGYSILMLRREDQAALRQVRSLEDLKKFSFGLGLGWLDVDILRHSGFTVLTGSNYDGLFQMLENRRFEVFPRAVVEVLDEYQARKPAMPDLVLDDSLVLFYPLPMYFWFARTPAGQRMAQRTEVGMLKMIEDGSYGRIFEHYQGWKIRQLKLGQRRLLSIDNPLLGPETPFKDKRLWFKLPGH